MKFSQHATATTVIVLYTVPMIYDWTSRESPRSARFIVTVFIHAHKTWLMRNTNNNKILFFYYYYRRVCVYASILYLLLLLFLFCPKFGSHELWTLSGRESRGNIAAVRLWHVENKKKNKKYKFCILYIDDRYVYTCADGIKSLFVRVTYLYTKIARL